MPRSIHLNRHAIRAARSRLGWSQAQLSSIAALSVRVVAKAESGLPVSRGTLSKLLVAFQSAGLGLDEHDLTACPIDLLKALLERYRLAVAGEHSGCHELLANDLLTHVDGEKSWLAIAGQHRGARGFERMWQDFFSRYRRAGGNIGTGRRITASAGGAIAWGHEEFQSLGKEPAPPCLLLLQITLCRGLISRLWIHFDAFGVRKRLEKR